MAADRRKQRPARHVLQLCHVEGDVAGFDAGETRIPAAALAYGGTTAGADDMTPDGSGMPGLGCGHLPVAAAKMQDDPSKNPR